ncbi:uncharacterized protein LOC128076084 isoform X2 [Tympanuchus pallidicinctus]|uniref:uncharacterized protein LOC128076084 isoform X2 n=1 Tax=Tympanuchus pallidicinctus TaxID=109042 RepID=UPI0022875FBA|nr:uncharacterized protein LOC128076084 isoform X2 [Tympanuchus pallidicinctus]
MSGAWIRLQRLCSDGANGGMGMVCVLASFRWMSSQPGSWGSLGEQTASSVSSLHGLHGAALSAAQHVRLSPLLQASAQVHKSRGERLVIPVCRMQFSLLRFVPPRKNPRFISLCAECVKSPKQAFPEASFLAKLDHCKIYWLRGELEFSCLSAGSRAVIPGAWPHVPSPVPSTRGLCPSRSVWLPAAVESSLPREHSIYTVRGSPGHGSRAKPGERSTS